MRCLCGPAPCRATFLFRKGFYSMDWKKVLRIAVCLVLVCALTISISPIRAHAAFLEMSAVLATLSDMACAGIALYTVFHSSGWIAEPPDHIGSLEEAGEALTHWVVENMYFPSSGDSTDDDEEDPEDPTPADVAAKAAKEAAKLGGLVREQVSQKWGTGDRIAVNLGAYFLGAATQFVAECVQNGYFDTQPDADLTQGYVQMGPFQFEPWPTDISAFPYIILYSSWEYDESVGTSVPVLSEPGWMLLSSHPFSFKITDRTYNGYQAFSYTPYATVDLSYKEWSPYYAEPLCLYYWSLIDSPNVTYKSSSGGMVSYGGYGVPIWSNYDVYSYADPSVLVLAASDGPYVYGTDILEPSAEVGSVVEGIKAGSLAAGDIPMPEKVDLTTVFSGIESGGLSAVHSNLLGTAQNLASGATSLDDYRQSITYVSDGSEEEDPGDITPGDGPTDPTEDPGPTEGVDDPDDPGGDNQQTPTDATFADFPVLNFLAQLGQLLQDISDGNLLGVKSFFDPWFESIGQWFQDIRGDISGVRDDLFDVDSSVQDVVDSNLEQNDILEQGFSAVSSIVAGAISNAAGEVVDAVKSTVVPDEDFLTNKVNTLCDEFSFVDSIVKTGTALHLGLAGISTEPPVIYIDLGANRGPHYLGGQVPFLDLRWYAEYKPTVDTIISAFLWICFVWRIFMNLPGIISGMPGDFVYHAADSMGVAPSLPARSAEYEHLRILNRRSMHRRE